MKKILMTLAAAFVAVSMSAQVYVGGTANLNTHGSDSKTYSIAPEIGYQLDNQLGVGIKLGYGYTKNAPTPSTTTLSVNPYLRYNFVEVGKVKVFVDGGIYFATSKQKEADANNMFGINVIPGISYNLTNKISIAAHANPIFSWDVIAPAHSTCTNNIELLNDFGVDTFRFGFYYNF
jgi:opacity protein-like surface antigen